MAKSIPLRPSYFVQIELFFSSKSNHLGVHQHLFGQKSNMELIMWSAYSYGTIHVQIVHFHFKMKLQEINKIQQQKQKRVERNISNITVAIIN